MVHNANVFTQDTKILTYCIKHLITYVCNMASTCNTIQLHSHSYTIYLYYIILQANENPDENEENKLFTADRFTYILNSVLCCWLSD